MQKTLGMTALEGEDLGVAAQYTFQLVLDLPVALALASR
jgi:hypothetical protein